MCTHWRGAHTHVQPCTDVYVQLAKQKANTAAAAARERESDSEREL